MIPIVTFDSGSSEVTRGALIDCPAELFSLGQIAYYQSCKIGWSRCPLGYLVYAEMDAMGRKLVAPGIYPDQSPAPQRKFPNYALRLPRGAIEAYVKSIAGLSEEVKSQRDREFKNLTHDLRAISAEIYHSALTARDEAERRNQADLARYIDDVMAAQQMMSLRLDIVDYESGHAAGRPKEKISVFKKVHKVVKCFRNNFEHRRIRARFEGQSFGFTFGPPIFEIIPFVIIENSVKYAPMGSDISVRFEDKDEEIVVRFESLGPYIKDSEKSKIFDQNFRGDAAKTSERSGSGIGLYAARTLLEAQFGGKIFVNQFEPSKSINGNKFWDTRFTIVVPRLSEEEGRHLYSRRR